VEEGCRYAEQLKNGPCLLCFCHVNSTHCRSADDAILPPVSLNPATRCLRLCRPSVWRAECFAFAISPFQADRSGPDGCNPYIAEPIGSAMSPLQYPRRVCVCPEAGCLLQKWVYIATKRWIVRLYTEKFGEAIVHRLQLSETEA